MRTVSTFALGLALALGAAAQPAYAAKDPKPAKAVPPAYSPKVVTAFKAAQEAANKGDIPTATTQAAAAEAAIATDDDRYLTGNAYLLIAQKSKDTAVQAKAVDLMIASGKAPTDQLATLYLAQAQTAAAAKDYAKALTALQGAQKSGSTEPNLVPMMVEMQYSSGQRVVALQTLNAAVDQMIAAGKPVPEEWYRRGLSFGYEVKAGAPDIAQVSALTTAISTKWVAAYPSTRNWHDALAIFREQTKPDADGQIDIYRLLRASNGLLGAGEYVEYAEGVYLRYPNEAQAVLQEGVSKGVVNMATNKNASEILALVKAKIPADKASLATGEKSALAAPNGRPALNTADALVTYGEYARAIPLYKAALTKGGVDANIVNLHLGQAQALSGDVPGAKQTLALVTGPRKAVADFWVVHLDHPTVG
jgi:hypothetical protein